MNTSYGTSADPSLEPYFSHYSGFAGADTARPRQHQPRGTPPVLAAPVMNSAARLVSIEDDHITPLRRQLHWLKASERTDYKVAVLVYKCLHEKAPSVYLADEYAVCHRTLAPDVDLVQHRHHRWSFAVHDCQLSATELSQSLQLMFGTVYTSTSVYTCTFCSHPKTHLFQH